MGEYKHFSGTGDVPAQSLSFEVDAADTNAVGQAGYSSLVKLNRESDAGDEEWLQVIPNAVYYRGDDELIFGRFYVMVYENKAKKCLNSVFFSKFGEVHYRSILLDKSSKYYPACENLVHKHKTSNIRRVLAVSCLRSFSLLSDRIKSTMSPELVKLDLWDETTAGKLACSMELVANKKPSDVGWKLHQLGFLQPHYINSMVLDVAYSNKTQQDIEDNNKLVFAMGEQLDQLFDPLTEYSPEPTEKVYQPPNQNSGNDSQLQVSICQELLQFQINFTKNLVDFLQNYILPLRIKVLNGSIKGYTTSKLNLIFPPTIDEVTRINCIYLDALKLAIPYGSFEVIKASGMTIPYFYKAYMRHEAATKNFTSNLKSFLGDLHRQGIQTNLNYTKQKMESIIHGSLNLTKIKLILKRLAQSETSNSEGDRRQQVNEFLESAILTIDSFAKQSLAPYNNRIFTPTGKMLTELAHGWPMELQYGWLTRRVVAVYDVENIAQRNQNEIFVIFSDHVLFLKVEESAYGDSDYHRPSISDLLMHSLINESPIHNVPALSVNGWSNIQDVHIDTYENDTMLKITINNVNGITSSTAPEPELTRIYRLTREKKSGKVIELINKAKILNKTQPFHLFKTEYSGLTLYSTAHDIANYNEELIKSPFTVFLKSDVDHEFMEANRLFFALSIYLDGKDGTDSILLKGQFIDSKHGFSRRIKIVDLPKYLCSTMSLVYERYFDHDINVTNSLRLIESQRQTLMMLDDYIHDRIPKRAAPAVTMAKPRLSNAKRSLEFLSGIRNSSNSSVVHNETRQVSSDSYGSKNSHGSRKSIGSRKSFTQILQRRSSNQSNQRSNSLVGRLKKVFKSKEELIESKENTEAPDLTMVSSVYPPMNATESTADSSSIYVTGAFNFPSSPDKPSKSAKKNVPVPKVDIHKDTKEQEADIKEVKNSDGSTQQKPLNFAQLHTSHSVRRKLTELMTEMDVNFYEDGEKNWEVLAWDSSSQSLSQVLENKKLETKSHKKYQRSSITKMIPEVPPEAPVVSSGGDPPTPRQHNYRALFQNQNPADSPIVETFVTPKLVQESPVPQQPERNQAQDEEDDDDAHEIFMTPYVVQDEQFKEIDTGFDDSFSINFDSVDSIVVDDVNGIESSHSNLQPQVKTTTFEVPETEESGSDVIATESLSKEEEDEMIASLGDQFDRCEPQPQQFTYKNTEDYEDMVTEDQMFASSHDYDGTVDQDHNQTTANESTIVNQIELSNYTASDFTMSSDSQEDHESAPDLTTWYSPSQLDMLSTFDKKSPAKEKKKLQFTSKINILQQPIEEKKPSNKQFYYTKEDSVKFDEPVLRSSSYSYLMNVLDGDNEFSGAEMTPIEEDDQSNYHAQAETTVAYDDRLQDNLKESSIRYLAGYI